MEHRKLITLWLFVFIVAHAIGQDYFVLQVKGTVKRNGTALKVNDIVKSADKLVFASAGDAVAVVNAKSGRFIIKPVSSKGSSEFIGIVRDAVTPGTKRLSTRAGSINNVIDFQSLFNEPVVLLDSMKIKVSTVAFPLSSNSFFFVRYNHRGEEINKKLAYHGDTVLINRNDLYSVDGKPIDPWAISNVRLFHFNNGNANQVSNLSFVNVDLGQLRNELAQLTKTLDAKKFNLKEECLLYMNDFYGKTREEDFTPWFKRNF